jgi:hypothetical protein
LSLRRSILMCGTWLLMFWTCYKPLQVSRSGRLILSHLNLVSLMHSGSRHLKVQVLHNVMEAFVELYLFIFGFQFECLLHSVPGIRQLLEVHSCRWSTEEVVPCQTSLQDHLGSENGTEVQLVKVTCKFKLYKLSSILHVIELARHVRV